MNFIKRGWYSTTRKPKKSVLLAVILCFISLLLVVATGIGSQQRQVQAEIRNQLGGSFHLSRNWDTLYRYPYGGEWGPDLEWVDFGGGGMPLPHPAEAYQLGLIRDDLRQISVLDGISDFNIITNGQRFFPVDFSNDRTHIPEGERPDPLFHDKVLLQGVLNAEMLDEIRHGFISLEAGRWIVPSDNENDDIPLVISSSLAELNGLSVGDTLTLDWEDERRDAQLDHFNVERLENREITGTIVGIFTINRSISPSMNSESLENTLFSRLDAFSTVMEDDLGLVDIYTDATFIIENIDIAKQVLADLENLDLEWVRYVVTTPADVLAQMSESFDGLQAISTFMFIGVLVAGFGILWLIFTLWIKNRTYETGILLAVGTEKRSIIAQFIFEAVLIAMVAMVVSFAVTPVVSNVIDISGLNAMVENQLSSDTTDIPSDSGIAMGIDMDTVDSLLADDFHQQAMSGLSLTAIDIVIVTSGILVLLVVSILMAMIPIMRMKPKEILTKMN